MNVPSRASVNVTVQFFSPLSVIVNATESGSITLPSASRITTVSASAPVVIVNVTVPSEPVCACTLSSWIVISAFSIRTVASAASAVCGLTLIRRGACEGDAGAVFDVVISFVTERMPLLPFVSVIVPVVVPVGIRSFTE